MLRRRRTPQLRVCPVCGSTAVSVMVRADTDGRRVPLSVRCGECATWRGSRVRPRAADALDAAIRADLELIERALAEAARRVGVQAPDHQAGVRHRRGGERSGG